MRFAGLAEKISSWVRPGVCEVRASIRRPVSALMRLDLPTLERPAKAISAPVVAGTAARESAAARNCQGVANSLRPASISADDRAFQEDGGPALPGMTSVRSINGPALPPWRRDAGREKIPSLRGYSCAFAAASPAAMRPASA